MRTARNVCKATNPFGGAWKPETRLRHFHASYFIEPNTGCWLWERDTMSSGYGEQRSRKLTAVQAIAISKDTRPSQTVADDYAINEVTVRDIRAGRRWQHITGVPLRPKKKRVIAGAAG